MIYVYSGHRTFNRLAKSIASIFNGGLIHHLNQVSADDICIIFGLNIPSITFNMLPKYYIAIQFEQSLGSKWFSPDYLFKLSRAQEIWDYSIVNCSYLKKRLKNAGLPVPIIKYYPLGNWNKEGTLKQPIPWSQRPIDLLFYGAINRRRLQLINALKRKLPNYKIEVKTNLWGPEKEQYLSKTKYLLNLHYYQPAILETLRITEALSYGAEVISETGSDRLLETKYKPYVWFGNNQESLIQICQQLLKSNERKNPNGFTLEYNLISAKERLAQWIQNELAMVPILTGDNGEVSMKISPVSDDDLPSVSIITITYNRRHLIDLMLHNWQSIVYPPEKLEWIIIDDSDSDQSLENLLPSDPRIKYYRIKHRSFIGTKRNLAVSKASHDYLCIMDDDDYYYPVSIRARIDILLSFPKYPCVGVNRLLIYDSQQKSCFNMKSEWLAEASLGFTKEFWNAQKFGETSHNEGLDFFKNRRHQLMSMPSYFNLIAITHSNNITKERRAIPSNLSGGRLADWLDSDSQLIIDKLF